MKSLIRNCLLTFVGILFALIHINSLIVDNTNNELFYASENAMQATQIVAKAMVQEKTFGIKNPYISFPDETAYFSDFKDNFLHQITSDNIYDFELLDCDLDKGLLSVKITVKYLNVLGVQKSIETEQTAIIDVVDDI